MRSIIAKLKGGVLGALSVEERRYYVDPDLPLERRRFTEAHEIGPDALAWHENAYFAEDHTTLAPRTRVALEAEANLFAAEILFAADRFTVEVDADSASIDVPLGLNTKYQTSAAAALQRYVSNSKQALALIGTGLKPSRMGHVPIYSALTCESRAFREKSVPLGSSAAVELRNASLITSSSAGLNRAAANTSTPSASLLTT